MEIIEYFTIQSKAEQEYWLSQIKKSDWGGGQFLYELLRNGKLRDTVGEQALVGLLTEGLELVSFCTYAPFDDIQPTNLGPWIGFVYTFPKFRGNHNAGKLFDYFESIASIMERDAVYISTCETGLYEKYGYEFFKTFKDIHGENSRVYRKCLKGEGVPEEELNDRKVQALFIRKHGLEDYVKLQNKLHAKKKFSKIQEILKNDPVKSLEILESVWSGNGTEL